MLYQTNRVISFVTARTTKFEYKRFILWDNAFLFKSSALTFVALKFGLQTCCSRLFFKLFFSEVDINIDKTRFHTGYFV